MQSALWTVGVAAVCSVMCALLGVWLVLQRLSMLGDAISHAVLPGLAVAFLITSSRASVPMFVGAVVAGIVTVLLTRTLSTTVRIREEAGMGVVFTVLFAIGVVLISRSARQIDLDPGCVLYGLIEFVSLDTVNFGGLDVPRALVSMVPTLLCVTGFLLMFRKELLLLSFDRGLAQTLGKKPNGLFLALMAMVAVATVASFEAVGSILVIAMLVGPAATAQLLTRKLKPMFGYAVSVALLSSGLGYWLAVRWDTSVAGMMSVSVGMCYAFAIVASPQGGLVNRWFRERGHRRRIQEQDVLAAVFRAQEQGQSASMLKLREWIPGALFSEDAVRHLVQSGRLHETPRGYELTITGQSEATALIRTHRLLEAFLTTEMGQRVQSAHSTAHRIEHFLGPEAVHEMDRTLNFPVEDPHGAQIPSDAKDDS